jgi:hypothetical protein
MKLEEEEFPELGMKIPEQVPYTTPLNNTFLNS